MEKAKWYVISCQKGNERNIANNIRDIFANSKYKDQLKEVKVIFKKIKTKENAYTLKNVYPGYIYLHIDLDNTTWYMVRNTTGVFSFIGSIGKKTKPIPLTRKEVIELEKKENQLKNQDPVYDIDFKLGQVVKIKKHQLFQNQVGEIISIHLKTGVVTIEVNFMNKKYKINVNYKDIEKLK